MQQPESPGGAYVLFTLPPMDAVVMAAGEGTRLRPLTDSYAKPVLPVDGRPVLATLLHELADAGVSTAFVVVGHLREQIERLVGDGRAFGLDVRYVEQPERLGSTDTVARALRAGARPPLLVSAADTVYSPGDIARFASAAAPFDGAIAVRRDPPPSPPHRHAVRIVDGLVERVLDVDPENPLAGAPLWSLGPAVAAHVEPPPDRPPHELANVFQAAIGAGGRVAGIEIGKTRDLTRPVDLVEENFPYLRGL
jgi:dTDP-glucose pyrophosphorylase